MIGECPKCGNLIPIEVITHGKNAGDYKCLCCGRINDVKPM